MRLYAKGFLLLTAIAVPSLLAAVFLFGCCILPFHNDLHGTMPLCHVASEVLTGHHDGDRHDHDHPATPPQSQGKSSFASSSTAETSALARLFVTTDGVRQRFDTVRQDYRSFITLGGVRCENDVGLQLLLTTFRI